jgi:hypothetical protein
LHSGLEFFPAPGTEIAAFHTASIGFYIDKYNQDTMQRTLLRHPRSRPFSKKRSAAGGADLF